MTPDHTAIQVHSSGQGRVGIGRSSGEGLNTGCHWKAPVRCPLSRLAVLQGAPRTQRKVLRVETKFIAHLLVTGACESIFSISL